MKINPNTDPLRVDGTQPPKPAAPATLLAADSTSFAGSAAVNRAIGTTPDSRPEFVARARALINDPAYPGNDILRRVSQLLAGQLTGPND